MFAGALAVVTDGQTIKLLDDITHSSYIDINNKSVTFDLNGYTLTVNESVFVYNGGKLLLANPANGEFNIDYNGVATPLIVTDAGSVAEVTNVTSNGAQYGVEADNTEIFVYGNVVNTFMGGYGAYAGGGSKVTIDGTITATNYQPSPRRW